MSKPNPLFQQKFEAGFEPSVTRDQKEHIESAKQKIGAAAQQVQGAVDDAHRALQQQQLHGVGQYTATTAATIHPAPQIDTEQHKGLLESAKDTIGGAMQTMKEKLSGGVEVTKEKLGGAMEATKEKAGEAVDATKQAAHNVYEAAGSAVDKTKEVAESAAQKTKEVAGSAMDKTKELAESAADKTRGAAHSAYDSAAHAVDATKQKAEDVYYGEPLTNVQYHPQTYTGQRVQYITPEEAERLGFAGDYPALLRGFDQTTTAYGATGAYSGPNEPAPDYLKESSNIGQGISSAVGSAGRQVREAAGSAAETGKGVLGAMGERLSGAVQAIVGEAPPNRELEQQGQVLIQQHREQQNRVAEMAREHGQGNLGNIERRQQAAGIMLDDRQRALNQQGKRFNEGANVISDFKQNAGQAMHDLGDKFKQP